MQLHNDVIRAHSNWLNTMSIMLSHVCRAILLIGSPLIVISYSIINKKTSNNFLTEANNKHLKLTMQYRLHIDSGLNGLDRVSLIPDVCCLLLNSKYFEQWNVVTHQAFICNIKGLTYRIKKLFTFN